MSTRFAPAVRFDPLQAANDLHRDELREAIPPAYTELIGTQLLAHIHAGVAA